MRRAEVSGGFRLTINKRMEIFAAIAGLEMLKQPRIIALYSDSQYLAAEPHDARHRAGVAVQRCVTAPRSPDRRHAHPANERTV